MSERRPLERLARGFRERTLPTAKLAAKLGFAAFKKSVGLEGGRSRADEEAVAAAEELVAQLDRLKGLVMKVGQMASYLDHSLPPAARKVLARLQHQSQPLAYARVAEVVQEELGGTPDELFDTFEETPFAAASIGQVHRAVFAGRPVAVKVQYPGIDRVLESDLATLSKLMRLGVALTPLDGKSLAAELTERISAECDYVAEAENQELFRELLGSVEGASVPAVVHARSARRVLTSELVRGRLPYPQFLEQADQATRDQAGELLFRASFGSIFEHCVYNGDPHPGNYLFGEDGDVTFLDFGCVRHFPAEMIDGWKRLAWAILQGDRPAFRDGLTGLGFVKNPRRFDWDFQWGAMRALHRPWLAKQPFTYTSEYVAELNELLLWNNPNKMKTLYPPEWLILNRLQWGLNSILVELGATVNYRDAWVEAISTPTNPVRDRSPCAA